MIKYFVDTGNECILWEKADETYHLKMLTETERLVKLYYQLGLSHAESFLAFGYKIIISKSTLKRILQRLCLTRKNNYSNIIDVALFILKELENSGQLHGYRWMHQKCINAGLVIPRDTVYDLLKLLDPAGIISRKRKRLRRRHYVSKGPNYVWHIDSYDKLKPYGIAINGCIDGFSRNIIWLEANTTNSDPRVIADYYIKALERKLGCPQRVRCDMGTENVHVEQMQKFLRRNHNDELSGDRSFMYGKSTHNQRIEWFWGCLRKESGQFWMNLFRDMASDAGESSFSGDFLDKALVQFCFMKLIQLDLDRVAEVWNTHTMQNPKGSEQRGGNRPFMLYNLPELYDVQNCLCVVDEIELQLCAEETYPKEEIPCDNTVKELCLFIMEEESLHFADNVVNAKELYHRLRNSILNQL